MSRAKIDPPEVVGESAEEPSPAPKQASMVKGESESPHDLKGNTAPGALISVIGQSASFLFTIGSMIVIARLVIPGQFGLVGMVASFTGFLAHVATLGVWGNGTTRSITQAQVSTLFWINLDVGDVIALVGLA